ncbi:ComEC/Rec2 family competence protein [Peptoniphilus equinus]|uniref:ComEC/Rec2 family competence protein n=1 Tax=Peptoniphilus equinus TaxID=3016343 RepID=A0ABY7QXB0_9FIRM|nr:ComEC/Rec2 family competence protein [Peptoniphilus equinus]WBW50740.1 ComEC/Rec2 family competence protein [Peptoniphilus equinus]
MAILIVSALLALIYPFHGVVIALGLIGIIVSDQAFKKTMVLFLAGFLFASLHVMPLTDPLPATVAGQGIVVDQNFKDATRYTVQVSPFQKILLYSDTSLKLGDIVAFDGNYHKPLGKMNPSDFNYHRYLQSEGIVGSVYSKAVQKLGINPLFGYKGQFREFVIDKLSSLRTTSRTFLSGVILSDSSILIEEDQELYRDLGIGHLLAMSGFHVTLVTGCISGLLSVLRLHKKHRYLIALALMLIYIFLVGLPISALRAWLMSCGIFLAFLRQRKEEKLKNILGSLGCILILNPFGIYSVSLWLSFGAVVGLYFVYPRLKSLWHVEGIVRESVLLSVSVFLILLPLTAWNFYTITWISVLSNVLLVPIFSLAMLLGFIFVFTPLSFFVAPALELCLSLGRQLGAWLIFKPVVVGKPTVLYMILYYVALFLLLRIGRDRVFQPIKPVLFSGLAALVIVQGFLLVPPELAIHSIYVGQGDSSLVTIGYKNYLIDAGGSRFENQRPGKYYVLNKLKSKGITHLDGLFISHFDEDHVDGVLDLLGEITIDKAYLPYYEDNIYIKSLNRYTQLSYLDRLQVGAFEFKNLGNYRSYNDANENSMVLHLKGPHFNGLFTGDAGRVNFSGPLNYLKVAHHGSKNSLDSRLISNSRPDFATISAGVDNSYNHPHGEVLTALRRAGTTVKVTKEAGEIDFVLNRGQTYVIGYKESPVFCGVVILGAVLTSLVLSAEVWMYRKLREYVELECTTG